MYRVKRIIPYACTVLLVALMTLFAETLNEKEIIFPEITALAVGYMVAKNRSWKVNGKRMLSLITGCAIIGVCIVRFVPFDTYIEVILAFTIAQVIFMFSGTTFAPFVSAIVLPVMMHTTSIVYPIAAFVLTLLVILFHKLFLLQGIRADEEYVPVMLNSRDDMVDTSIRILCVTVIAGVAFRTGYRFVVAPPLLVAFTEFSRPRNKTRNMPVKTVAVITVCAIIGVISRYFFAIWIGLPITVSAIVATSGMLIVIHFTKMYMPPVGAITMLSMIISESVLITYPIQIFVGSSLILFLSRMIFMRRQDNKLYEKEHELHAE